MPGIILRRNARITLDQCVRHVVALKNRTIKATTIRAQRGKSVKKGREGGGLRDLFSFAGRLNAGGRHKIRVCVVFGTRSGVF